MKRIDVRPDKGVAKAWLHTDYEAQVDLGTAEILQIAYRRSDWIESIHDGSIFGDTVKLVRVFPGGHRAGAAVDGRRLDVRAAVHQPAASASRQGSERPNFATSNFANYPTLTVISVASSDGSDVPRNSRCRLRCVFSGIVGRRRGHEQRLETIHAEHVATVVFRFDAAVRVEEQ